jgi:hypothetical protein
MFFFPGVWPMGLEVFVIQMSFQMPAGSFGLQSRVNEPAGYL